MMAKSNKAIVETVTLAIGDARIEGDLRVPAGASGIVVFAHGSGSSRFSGRNRAVAAALEGRGLGTLLLDLLTREEEALDAHTGEFRFDIPRLAARVVHACDWIAARADLVGLSVGCFGASTGAAAALIAAAERSGTADGQATDGWTAAVRAVVSRGGRPDLAGEALALVRAPTLLIVGGADHAVIELNREAMARMHAVVRLDIIPHATHLFEEPGALAQVAQLAGDWFTTHLRASSSA